MKVTVTVNSSKTKKFFPKTEDKAAQLGFQGAEKITKHGSDDVRTNWHYFKVFGPYAEKVYRQLHEDKPVSRKMLVEGVIIEQPKVRVGNDGNTITTEGRNVIWVNNITWLDQNWPESQQPEEEEVPAEMTAVELAPWD